jgi:mannitol/fructose-specific phosphotransferase system IIA component (Ntr-type)
MALVTSLISGPMLQKILRLKKPRKFTDYLQPQGFIRRLDAVDSREVIRELSQVIAPLAGLDAAEVCDAVLAREKIMATGIGHGVAVPHARFRELTEPLVGIGFSDSGIDFDAPDETAARIICLILTPAHDNGAQLEILADIAVTFKNEGLREKALHLTSYTELLALVKSGKEA